MQEGKTVSKIPLSLPLMLALSLVPASVSAQWVVRATRSEQAAELERRRAELDRLANLPPPSTTRSAIDPSLPTEAESRAAQTAALTARIGALESAAAKAETSPLLPQAGVNVGKDGATVGLQALEFFVTKEKNGVSGRFYLRSTLPVKTDQPADTKTTPSDALRAGILDPFGGIVNGALGVYATKGTSRRVEFDGRAGFKLLETPAAEATSTSTSTNKYDTNPFVTASATLKTVLTLYRDPDNATNVGTLGLALGGNLTSAAAKEYLQTLTDVKRTTVNLTLAAVIDLPGVFYITIDGSPWSNSSALGKRFVVSFNVARGKSGGM